MANELRFDGRVAIVTGAGGGLGRCHALLLGSRGCKVVVNDLGGGMHGGGQSATPADKVVAEIKALGGDAVANYDSVEDGAKIVQAALDTWGRIDIVINNAGILRDTSFPKLTEQDWDLIYRVHVLGAFRVTHAAWNHMRDAGYGRVIFTSSAAGVYGNFGQANYSMAKLGLLGLANTLAIEGQKRGILVNTLVPVAGSRLTETVLPKELTDALKPELVSPIVAYLCHESSKETGGAFEVGGGVYTKLRWQRTVGKSFPIGKAPSLEAIAAAMPEITDFSKATNPPSIAASMEAVIQNLGNKSRGGNDLIDVDQALGFEYPPVTSSYDERDLSLYALGVGAATDPLDDKELRYVYEMHGEGFRAVPTYAVVPAINALVHHTKNGLQAPGLKYGVERILHGEQYTEVKRPLSPKAKLTTKAKVKDIFDKGKNAIVVTSAQTFDESGEEVAYNEISILVRGAGGWGGDRGPSADVNTPPDRAPDKVVEQVVSPNQALLYRLSSGDPNPLHVDVGFAKAVGFDRPILHGLCTFGYAGHAVVKAMAGNEPGLFKSIRVRFSESVFPGETLITEMWKESDTKIILRCKVKERDKVVISNAAVELYTQIPAKKAVPAAKAAPAQAPAQASAPAAAAAPEAFNSADVFVGIADYIARNPDLVGSVGTVFQFKLTSPDSAWSVDVKNGKGGVTQGTAAADVTLELSEADFLAMSAGQVDPQKLYFSGKLKISGNVMASQKLMFLKKIDPNQAKEAVMAARKAKGQSAPAAAPAPAAPAPAPAALSPDTVTSADVFVGIADHIAKNPDLVTSVGTVFQFKLTNPASAWSVDVKNGKGSVTEGTAAADVTLELSDEDFLAMSSGKADPQKLYFGGKLKISGNIMASQKLMFLKKIDPNQAKDAVIAARKARAQASAPAASAPVAAAPAASAPAASGGGKAKALFDALGKRLSDKPEIAAGVGAIVAFEIASPASSWVVDLKNGAGSVKEGKDAGATTTLSLAEDDLLALAAGHPAQELFQHGKLKVTGDMGPAHKLDFLKGLG